jgi:NADH dehydrogenase (ubiquinone) 1 alpha subcomplex subunit 13
MMASSTIQSDLFHRELQREKVWSRIHLVPLLMAEGDRDLYRRQQAALAREKEIMKDVPGWQVRFISCPALIAAVIGR